MILFTVKTIVPMTPGKRPPFKAPSLSRWKRRWTTRCGERRGKKEKARKINANVDAMLVLVEKNAVWGDARHEQHSTACLTNAQIPC
jgi:hypothetical protein